jgi:hypothetical protein
MTKRFVLALALVATFVAPTLAEPVSPKIELKLGTFRNASSSGEHKEQLFEVKNGTDSFLQAVVVECGFYSADGSLVATSGNIVDRINPGDIARDRVRALDTPTAIRAMCRIASARK